MSEQHAEREQRVTPLELLFDLVFVFAFTQVTTVAVVAIVWVALHAYEIIWWREARARTRALRVTAAH